MNTKDFDASVNVPPSSGWLVGVGAFLLGIAFALAVCGTAMADTEMGRFEMAQVTGSLKVTLGPAAAVTAGARWNVDGGAWRISGTTASALSAGRHTVAFKAVTGWVAPVAATVYVTANNTSNLTGTYTVKPGSVSVTIEPEPALTEGAQWKLDSGAWKNSGVKLNNVSVGTHTITFKAVNGWNTPASKTITVASSKTASAAQIYQLTLGSYVVLGYNDLGMHCMNQDFSEFMILPPYNTLHAQVFRRGSSPKMITSGISVSYSIPGNTTSVSKTNFWSYARSLFGTSLPIDVGLTGNRLSGNMTPRKEIMDWEVTGIPITQMTDAGKSEPLQLAEVSAWQSGTRIARTATVVPVSWEISCDLCHTKPGMSVATAILRSHDQMHATQLENSKPVVCGSCHAQPPLGLPGVKGVKSLSGAMHGAHAARMQQVTLTNSCYACHPGVETQCLRDVHAARGMNCVDCHGDMTAVSNPARKPWVDEPKCGSCHQREHFTFEEPGKLYRDSRGHHEVECATCHGSPHAITPTTTKRDNIQSQMVQGHSGVLDCAVCHINKPSGEFEHHL